MIERIKAICKDRKIAISKLEHDLNFSNGYIANLKKGTITADRLYLIANYLDLSMEYLITGEERLQKEPLPKLTDEESIILELFRKTAPTDKTEIKEYIEFKIQKKKAQP